MPERPPIERIMTDTDFGYIVHLCDYTINLERLLRETQTLFMQEESLRNTAEVRATALESRLQESETAYDKAQDLIEEHQDKVISLALEVERLRQELLDSYK